MGFIKCQDIYAIVVFPKAFVQEHQRRKHWLSKSEYKYLDINIWGWGERRQAEHNTEEESLLLPNLRMARYAWDEVSKQLSLNGSG